jgi:hypothetical protein
MTSPVTFFALNGRSSAFQQEIKGRATGVELLGHSQLEAEEIDSEAEDEEAVPVEVVAAAARAVPQPPKMKLPENPFAAAQPPL